ncbi:hypothetical protein ACHAQJ_008001 [Trichoderma viride]
MQRREPIPEHIVEIGLLPCTAQTPRERAHQELFRIFVDLTRARHMSAHQSADPEVILVLVKTVDISLERWAASMPDEYAFSTVPAVPSQNTLHGVYHHYSDRHIARLWNGYRMGSITNITNMLRHAALIKTPELLDDLAMTLDRQRQMLEDLCDSVPYYELQPPMTAIVGHTVLWPLYCVATADHVTAHMRTWVLQRMYNISIGTATMQGVQIADTLARQREITVWERKDEIDEESREW